MTSLVLVATVTHAATQLKGQVGPDDVAATVSRMADDRGFSGTVLVQDGDHRLLTRSFGLASREFEIASTIDTRYRIASVTKLFTAVLVLQLVDAGRLDLNAPIGTALPTWTGPGADSVTPHHLLTHTSGLAQYDRVTSREQAETEGLPNYQRPLTPSDFLQRCCHGPLVGPAGQAFDYNNADYLLLGRLIEHITGQPFGVALQQRILDRLGLRSTGLAHSATLVRRLAATYMWREQDATWAQDLPVYVENWDAAGSMYSSAEDMLTFAEALFGGRLLPKPLLNRLLTPVRDEYGYGLWVYSFGKPGGVQHRVAKRPGRIMGANAVLYRFLDRPTTIVLLANTDRVDLDKFAQDVASLVVTSRPAGGAGH